MTERNFKLDTTYLDESEIPVIEEILSGKGLHEMGHDRVLIKIHKPSEKIGNIWVSDITKENQLYNMVTGMIIGMGDDCYKTGPYANSQSKPRQIGEWVTFSYKSPNRMEYKGVPVVFVYDDQIHARVDDPSTLKRG